ncbi:hypothetical protein RRG08_003634 [Elysia crispata]|uniref:Transmembrane protein 69 n=1 Tax=Elysia crispata TaxID=231223 RepID=A0AAE1AW62_9GAST|nr:hypothetical protein RRG08_003634 [Elysia crispata]
MLTLALAKNCRVGFSTCLHHARQMAVCKIHVLQTQQIVMEHMSLQTPQEYLSIPFAHVAVQKLHSTGIVLKPEGQNSNILPIKGKPPSGQMKKGRFEFFSVRSLLSSPGPYMLYGLGGLIPFMSAPFYMYLTGEFNPSIAQAQLVYGACILSFLGGVSWGNHLNRTEKASLQSLSYSILLPLIAWPAVLLYPNPISFLTMTGGIVYAGVRDTGTLSYPRWFKNLRFLLSTLVAISLSATLVFKFTLKSGEDDASSNYN